MQEGREGGRDRRTEGCTEGGRIAVGEEGRRGGSEGKRYREEGERGKERVRG